jgi:hypothetical protein
MFSNYLTEILDEIKSFKGTTSNGYYVYRGQAQSSWNLRPSLFVKQLQKSLSSDSLRRTENNMYFDFTVNAKGILDPKTPSWETLFLMRHYGLPTRILDWTESLNIAIYFAVYGQGDSPCIWMLDPHQLNEISLKNSDLFNPLAPSDGIKDYCDAFISTSDTFTPYYTKPFAVIAPRMSDRIFAQRGLFTVQTDNVLMIDEMPDLLCCVKKIELLRHGATKNDIKEYLKLMGINHFTVYPDFEGLRMFLLEEYKLE